MEEYLFARGPNKVLVTVYTSDWAVLVFTIVIRFQCGSGFRLCHIYSLGSVSSETTFRRANKELRVKDRTLFGLSTNEAKRPAVKRLLCGQLVYNYGENVSRSNLHKTGGILDNGSCRMGASALE